jgi:HPt (histidine-containing phosphotransfer) domain-containing protein
MPRRRFLGHYVDSAPENVPTMPTQTEAPVLDMKQLRNVCMEDTELMRELVTSLVEDANSQIPALREAVEHADAAGCARLAHYVKGACANVGAASLAALMKGIELNAKTGDFAACRTSLASLATELQRFSTETASI